MSDIIITPNLGNVGEIPCYPNEQARYVDFMSKTVWKIPLGLLTGVWVSDVAPADDTLIWYRLNASTNSMDLPTPFIYSTFYGQWVALHPVPASGKQRSLWVGTPAELEVYDGGEVAAVSPTTGPFWEVDTDYEDRVPGGVKAAGTIAAVATDYDVNEAQTSAPNTVEVRGTYIIKRTARMFHRG